MERERGRKIPVEEEKNWIESFLSGEKKVFDNIVMKYQDRVFNLCYRFLGDYEEAEECAQEVFIKVYNSLRKFKFRSSFSTWLYRITVNMCKNRLKILKQQRERSRFSLDDPLSLQNGNLEREVGDESLAPLTLIQRKEKERIIQEAINSLPPEFKTLIILRDIDGLSYEEITGITGLKMGTVKSRIARAREKLKEKLRGLV
ncbi:MAG TPA: sigma-70 family RNA polymerase sigma factor [bacterium]|nr:sigma-70 family RNA polymerase sigma factor [bacterium]HEX67512.1 sigma-70 family RNA polymerase sigma factor [bacterium]